MDDRSALGFMAPSMISAMTSPQTGNPAQEDAQEKTDILMPFWPISILPTCHLKKVFRLF
jgi:hypothetical protein